MATTRQLRGGDYVLRVGEEDLDILQQGIQTLDSKAPDFSKVEPAFRETMERTYAAWHKRVEKLQELISNVTAEAAEEDAEEEQKVHAGV